MIFDHIVAFRRKFAAVILLLLTAATVGAAGPSDEAVSRALAAHGSFDKPLREFFSLYCNDCHGDGADEGGFEAARLDDSLQDPATFAEWELVYDRIRTGEMPPPDAEQPSRPAVESFLKSLARPLNDVHRATKATVLRRLNRREYENTMNDVFGTQLDLERLLPEDARSHEFDNVGETLGISMVHLQRYMDAARLVLETAIEDTTETPTPKTLTAWYKDTREAETHVGKTWKLLDDGFVARFSGGGYPSGMLRGSGVNQAGKYRIRITGYAYQSDQSITFSVGGTSFQRGSDKPIYGFFTVPPGHPTTIELETWIEPKYMVQIEPFGIADTNRYQRKSIDEYDGPGLAIGEVTVTGPLIQEYPSRGHQLLFAGVDRSEVPPKNPRDRTKRWYIPKFEIDTAEPNSLAKQVLLRVANATLRRPIKIEAIDSYLQLFEKQLREDGSIESALRTAVVAMLCSPRFLYLNEPVGKLDDYAIATRLSYCLHRTSPDQELLDAAGREELSDAASRRKQIRRLMDSQRFERFLADFADSWLDLREMDFTAPDQKLFPEFDPFLRYSMPRETLAFLREMIGSNLPIRNLVRSDFAMLNSRLAEHYDLPPLDGAEIRKVTLPPDSVRGGLLAQASILKVTANGTNTSPVTRGAWVMERMEGITPPPPPPGVPGVEPDIRGATTLRELLDKHRDADNCRACHVKIDPPGFALESFNPIGGYRERYRSLGKGDRAPAVVSGRRVSYRLGPAVDPSGKFPDGKTFEGFREFRDELATRERMIAKTFLTKFLTFATGREMGFSDRPEINRLVTAAGESNYRCRDLILAALSSDIFLSK